MLIFHNVFSLCFLHDEQNLTFLNHYACPREKKTVFFSQKKIKIRENQMRSMFTFGVVFFTIKIDEHLSPKLSL